MAVLAGEPAPILLPASPPWLEDAIFPPPPEPDTYGYLQGKHSRSCSQAELLEQIQRDTNKAIALVWTPDTSHAQPPEALPWLFEALRDRERAYLKQAIRLALLNTVLFALTLAMSAATRRGASQFQAFLLVTLGVIPLLEQSWGLYRLPGFTLEALARRLPEARYTAWLGRMRAPWSWALLWCISTVALVQLLLALRFLLDPAHSTIAAAGIVKPAICAGEWWRLLTGTLLHGNVMPSYSTSLRCSCSARSSRSRSTAPTCRSSLCWRRLVATLRAWRCCPTPPRSAHRAALWVCLALC